ncbi:hypothetical protein UFOVP1393_42 [uncultured Caudovirales phage]|uniref:Uncharacterized protein n=1 Tax=uncultured Caudovirales phage TaxID=2100421 RepID=A0A6J5S6V8_9CAUD|nr:hypothetical protein UFOVP1393_42 [uncultured Caudovirales phage]
MADVLFIQEDYFKKLAGVDGNVDWKKLESTIIMVQDIYIQKILGTNLYNDLKTKIIASPTMALYPNEKALINEYIAKALCWYVKMEASPDFKFAYQNKGIQVKGSADSSSADIADVKYLMDKWRIHAERYSQLCTDYLVMNTNTFPKYLEVSNTGMNPTMRNYTNGVAMRGAGEFNNEAFNRFNYWRNEE